MPSCSVVTTQAWKFGFNIGSCYGLLTFPTILTPRYVDVFVCVDTGAAGPIFQLHLQFALNLYCLMKDIPPQNQNQIFFSGLKKDGGMNYFYVFLAKK